MKRLLLAAAAVAALFPTLASAQDHHRGGPDGEHRFRGQGAQGAQRAPGAERPAFRGRGVTAQPPAQAAPAARPDSNRGDRAQRDFNRGDRNGPGRNFDRGDNRFDRGQNRNFDRGQNRDFDRGARDDGRRDFGGRDFNRRDDRRDFDRRDFDRRGGFENRRFSYRGRSYPQVRVAPYRWPGGAYRSYAWRPRMILPRTFFVPDYFIGNYYDYGFGAPPPGTEWIRVGDDALLVDIYTGEIIDVALGVFYW
jgi:Ni/Co efflux regulator RcnB